MKKILLLLFCAVCFSACDRKNTINVICGDYDVKIDMSEDGEKLNTTINDENVNFNIAISASGVRYVGIKNETEIVLWNKGDDWTLYFEENTPISCTAK